MPETKLIDAVCSVDWKLNVDKFAGSKANVALIAAANYRLAVWANQLELVNEENPAICFVREMQIASQNTAAALSLALYKLAAGSMRTVVETALYFSYFRTHPSELATLVRDSKFYIGKQEVIDYHKTHTDRFFELQGKVDLVGRLGTWYSKVSAVIHGQIPGAWIKHKSLKDIAYDERILTEATATYIQGVDIVHFLLLLTVGRENWDTFSSPTKRALLKGMPGDLKTHFGLDSA